MWYLKWSNLGDLKSHFILLGINDFSQKNIAEKLAVDKFLELKKLEGFSFNYLNPILVWADKEEELK